MKGKLLAIVIFVAAAAAMAWHWAPRAARPAARFEPQARAVLATVGAEESTSPQLAFTTNDTLYLLAGVGPASHTGLALSLSHDGGDSFTPPLAISPPDATVMTRGEMGPVLRAKGEGVFALWQQTVGQAPSQIVVARSTNSGRTFSTPVDVVRKDAKLGPSFSGFANLSLSPQGELYAVWLDGRDPKRAPGTFGVYLAHSSDKGATWGDNVLVADGSCPCCRPAIAADGRGNVYVAWRKVYPGDQRDLALSVSHDGGRSFAAPVRVADEQWTLHACPESGPALALRHGAVVAAWYSGAGVPGIRVASSGDGGKTFRVTAVSARVMDQNHPRLSLSEDGQLWLSLQGREAAKGNVWPPLTPFLVEVADDGGLSAPVAVPGGALSGYPALAAGSAGRLFVASAQEAMGHDSVVLVRGRGTGTAISN